MASVGLQRVVRRLTPIEFEAARALVNKMSDARVAAARSVLVDGASLQSASDAQGWVSRNTAHEAAQRIWAAHERAQELAQEADAARALLPPGWEQVTLVAPTSLIRQWRKQVADYVRENVPAVLGGQRSKTASAGAAVAPKRTRKKAA